MSGALLRPRQLARVLRVRLASLAEVDVLHMQLKASLTAETSDAQAVLASVCAFVHVGAAVYHLMARHTGLHGAGLFLEGARLKHFAVGCFAQTLTVLLWLQEVGQLARLRQVKWYSAEVVVGAAGACVRQASRLVRPGVALRGLA